MKPSAPSVLATGWMALVSALTLPLIYAAGLVVTAVDGPRRHRLHRFIAATVGRYLDAWPGWRVRVEGAHHLPDAACVLVANHQSASDILALLRLPAPFKFVSKASLFTVPLVGPTMRRMGHVALVRGRRSSMEAMMARCEALLAGGERVLIFPEATYAPPHGRLPFRRGAFRLAQKAQVPVVPVVLTGTRSLLVEDGPWFAARASVTVAVHPPVTPPAPSEPLEPYIARLEAAYAGWLGEPFITAAAPVAAAPEEAT